MKHNTIFILLVLASFSAFGQASSLVKDQIRATQEFRVGSNTSQKIQGFDTAVPGMPTNTKLPTTKAVVDWVTGAVIMSGSTAGGDLAGTYPSPTVNGLQGRAISATVPTMGQVYKWTGSQWAPAADDNTGTTYTSGTGISIVGSMISNTGDLSTTNEIQNLSLTGQALGISNGTGVTLPIVDVVAGTNVTVTKAAGVATINAAAASGITSLNGLTAGTQTFATSTTGTDFTISSSVAAHTFNLPTASATNRGALSTTDWSAFNAKVGGSGSAGQVAYFSAGSTLAGNSNLFWNNSTGRLGIGTSSPGALLQVNGNTWVNRLGINIDPSSLGATLFGMQSSSNSQALYRAYNSTGSTRIAWDLASDVPTAQFIGNAGTITINPGTTTTFSQGSAVLVGGTGTASGKLQVIGTNSSGGTYTLWLANSSANELFKIRDDAKIEILATNTAAGTTGAQTINRPTGTVNFAAGATSLTVTNNLCQTTSIVFAMVRTNDATAVVKNVVPASGSFTINLTAAATAETSVGFWVIN